MTRRTLSIGNIAANPGEKSKGWLTVAELPGSYVQIPIAITNGLEDGPVLFLLSGIHGAEYNPIESNIRLQKSLDPRHLHGAVISCLVANIGAFNTRTTFINPLDGKDISRSFPGKVDGTISEKIAYVLYNEFVKQCDYMIDMHGGDFIENLKPMTIQPVTGNSDLDSKIAELVKCFAGEYTLLRERDRLANSTAGEAAFLGKPSFIVESGKVGTIDESDVSFYLDGLTNMLRYLKMIEGQPRKYDHTILAKAALVMLKRGGIWHPVELVGARVKQGQLLGIVTDVFGETVEEVKSPTDGVILFHVTAPGLKAGDAPLWIGQFSS